MITVFLSCSSHWCRFLFLSVSLIEFSLCFIFHPQVSLEISATGIIQSNTYANPPEISEKIYMGVQVWSKDITHTPRACVRSPSLNIGCCLSILSAAGLTAATPPSRAVSSNTPHHLMERGKQVKKEQEEDNIVR